MRDCLLAEAEKTYSRFLITNNGEQSKGILDNHIDQSSKQINDWVNNTNKSIFLEVRLTPKSGNNFSLPDKWKKVTSVQFEDLQIYSLKWSEVNHFDRLRFLDEMCSPYKYYLSKEEINNLINTSSSKLEKEKLVKIAEIFALSIGISHRQSIQIDNLLIDSEPWFYSPEINKQINFDRCKDDDEFRYWDARLNDSLSNIPPFNTLISNGSRRLDQWYELLSRNQKLASHLRTIQNGIWNLRSSIRSNLTEFKRSIKEPNKRMIGFALIVSGLEALIDVKDPNLKNKLQSLFNQSSDDLGFKESVKALLSESAGITKQFANKWIEVWNNSNHDGYWDCIKEYFPHKIINNKEKYLKDVLDLLYTLRSKIVHGDIIEAEKKVQELNNKISPAFKTVEETVTIFVYELLDSYIETESLNTHT